MAGADEGFKCVKILTHLTRGSGELSIKKLFLDCTMFLKRDTLRGEYVQSVGERIVQPERYRTAMNSGSTHNDT